MIIRWGIFGTGLISANFIAGLSKAKNAKVSYVASRSLKRAQKFASDLKVPRVIQGYAEAVKSGEADVIYIATPTSEHLNHALLCIEAGIPVLVEKPFANNELEAEKISQAAKSKSVFAMEAMWTRFLPAAQEMKEKIDKGTLGEVRLLSANIGYSKSFNPSNKNGKLQLGKGSISRLGVYPLSLAQWIFGTPKLVQAMGTLGSTGINEDAVFQLRYPGGIIGAFYSSLRSWAPNDFHVMGTNGKLSFNGPIIRPYGLTIFKKIPIKKNKSSYGWRMRLKQKGWVHRIAQIAGKSSHSGGKKFNYWYEGNGYHYEADEVRSCIQRGINESRKMPLSDSIAVAATIDNIRKLINESSPKKEN